MQQTKNNSFFQQQKDDNDMQIQIPKKKGFSIKELLNRPTFKQRQQYTLRLKTIMDKLSEKISEQEMKQLQKLITNKISSQSMKISDFIELQEILEQRIQLQLKKEEITNALFLYFQKKKGKINSFNKYLSDIGNNCSFNVVFGHQDQKICNLFSQCYATSYLIDYFFGKPEHIFFNIFGKNFENDFKNKKKGDIINVKVSINTLGHFIGHVFNFIVINKQKVFWCQSYLHEYTFNFTIIDLKKMKHIIETYINIFQDQRRPQLWTKQDFIHWKYLTDTSLPPSLHNEVKPHDLHITYNIFHTLNLKNFLNYRYLHLLNDVQTKLIHFLLNPNADDESMLKRAFGQKENYYSVLDTVTKEWKMMFSELDSMVIR